MKLKYVATYAFGLPPMPFNANNSSKRTASKIEIMNEPSTVAQPMKLTTPFGNTLRPNPFIKKPRNGSSGIRSSKEAIGSNQNSKVKSKDVALVYFPILNLNF